MRSGRQSTKGQNIICTRTHTLKACPRSGCGGGPAPAPTPAQHLRSYLAFAPQSWTHTFRAPRTSSTNQFLQRCIAAASHSPQSSGHARPDTAAHDATTPHHDTPTSCLQQAQHNNLTPAPLPTSATPQAVPLLWSIHSLGDREVLPTPHMSVLRSLLTPPSGELAHPSLRALLQRAAALAAANAAFHNTQLHNQGQDQHQYGGQEQPGHEGEERLLPLQPITPSHLLAALLQLVPEVCPGLHAVLLRHGCPSGAAAAEAWARGSLLLPQSQGVLAPPGLGSEEGGGPEAEKREREGTGEDEDDQEEGEEVDLGPATVAAWLGVDSAFEANDLDEADLRECGMAADRQAHGVLLQAYRWAMRTGSRHVSAAHVAHALLAATCHSRFHWGAATHPPCLPLLELHALLPGLACHEALHAVQVQIQHEATGDPAVNANLATNSAEAPALPTAGSTTCSDRSPATAAVVTAAELLSSYGRARQLPSRSALDALAASLPSSAPATHTTTTTASLNGPHRSSAHSTHPDQGPAPPHAWAAVHVLTGCAALGYRLPHEALRALYIRSSSSSSSSSSFSSSSTSSTSSTTQPRLPSSSPSSSPCPWLSSDPALLLEWLEALAFHGALPQPHSRQSPSAPQDTLTTPHSPPSPTGSTARYHHHQQQLPQQQSQDGSAEASASSSPWPPASSPTPLHPCDPWLHDTILSCLAHATPWQLPPLAARLAAAAAAASSPLPHSTSSPPSSSPPTSLSSSSLWLSLAVRATELAARCCLHITPLWNGNRIYQDLVHVADAMLTLYDLAAAAPTLQTSTPLSTGQERAQQNVDDQVATGGSPAKGEGSSAAAGAEAAAREAEGRAWGALQAWAALELPHQAERWLRKLGARVHKGAGRGLAHPLPREPEWPAFEQGALLLDQAVRLAEAVRAVRHGEAVRGVRMVGRGCGGMDGTDGAGPAVPLEGRTRASPHGEADVRLGQQQRQQLHQEQQGSPLRLGLVVNLLAVLQAQLRTPSAGPDQLRLVLSTLEQLEQGQGEAWGLAPAGLNAPVGPEVLGSAALSHQAVAGSQDTGTGGPGAFLGRHGGWARTAGKLYGSLLVAGCCTAGGGQSVTEAVAARVNVAGGVVGLLPSLVVGQVYRGWVPGLQTPVAAVLQAAVRGAYHENAGESVLQQVGQQQQQQEQQEPEAAYSTESRAKERLRALCCLERLGYPLPYTTTDTGVTPAAPPPGELPMQPQRRVGLRAGMAAAGSSGAISQEPGRAAGGAPGSSSPATSVAAAAAASPPSTAGLAVARPYPETTNLPALPPPALPSVFPAASRTPLTPPLPTPAPEAIRHAPLGLLVSSLLSSLRPTSSNSTSSTSTHMATHPQTPTTTPSTQSHRPSTHASTSSPAPAPTPLGQAPFLAPPGAMPRVLALSGPQLRLLVSGLLSYPPSALRPDELWVCHVAERDTGVGLMLQQMEQRQEEEHTEGVTGPRLPGEDEQDEQDDRLHGGREAVAVHGVGRSAALSARWAAWLHAARELQLAAANPACAAAVLASSNSAATANPAVAVTGTGSLLHSSRAGTTPGDRVALGSDGLPFAHVLLSSAATPAVVSRLALPPVACLELLLLHQQHKPPSGTGVGVARASGGGGAEAGGGCGAFTLTQERGRTAAAQWVLGAMWQGDWFRGDPSTLARFRAEELLFVACLLAEMWEAQELAGQDLGWTLGDAAADGVLSLLACPSLPALLAHRLVAWGVGPTGAFSPGDLVQEKRTRSQKLLDAAVDVEEWFGRVLQALQLVAAFGRSGVLGGGRLDPYRPMAMQGDSMAAFEGHVWVQEQGGGREGSGSVAGGVGGGVGKGGWVAVLGEAGVERLRRAMVVMGRDPEGLLRGG